MREKILKCLLHYGEIALREPKTEKQLLDRVMYDRLYNIWNKRYEEYEKYNDRT